MRTTNNPDDQENFTFIEAARRAQIIESTIEVLAELGFAKTSLAQIAKRAKISKGVISYYFASKEELLQQIAAHVFEAGANFMKPLIEAESTPAAMLRVYIESNIAFMRAYPHYIRAVVEIIPNFRKKDGSLFFTLEANEPVLESLQLILKWGQERGDFRDFSPRVMALTIRSAIDAVTGRMTLQPDLDVENYGKELAALFDHATRKA